MSNNKLDNRNERILIDDRLNKEKRETLFAFYRLSADDRYHYEFRYEFNPSTKRDNHRVMLILYGAKRACADMWDFSVGMRTLAAIHHFGYSILAICSTRQTYDINLPIGENNDAKYVYLSLQKWINKVYYPRFQHYPRLYIHATSRGSRFAGILCKILPIQAQILYIFPGHQEAMVIPSAYDSDLQRRLTLDPTFANWFYFDLCYNETTKKQSNQTLCPFHSDRHYSYPLPPSFFTYLKNDPYQTEEPYRYFLKVLANNAVRLGGTLLNHAEALQLDILPPAQPTPLYMQENFHIWRSKPHAAQLFFEHFTHPKNYSATNSDRRTCWCSEIDFKYFESIPSITKTWSRERQDEYSDYVRDIRRFEHVFCEEVCGDLLTTHSMSSRNINQTLLWIGKIDQIRRSLYLDDYSKRPLRIWMYDKRLLIKQSSSYSSRKANWINASKEYQMYSPEYLIQDYFLQLNKSKETHTRHLQWTVNPLLADYFIIPCDLMFFYFEQRPSALTRSEFDRLLVQLDEDYVQVLLTNIRSNFPYWTLTRGAKHVGANHILPIPGGRNMGILSKKTQKILKNVIQIAFTGVRRNSIPSDTASRYAFRGLHIVYRHHYDVLIPQFTPLNMNRSRSAAAVDALLKKKKRLFYFAGTLGHSTSFLGARPQLSILWRDLKEKRTNNMTTEIQGRLFEIMEVIDGHIETPEYIQSIQSSVFSLCPEGFLPWSPRLYESIQIGAIPIILADNLVLPFERFIDWRSFSVKINISNIGNITGIVTRIDSFQQYIKDKLTSAVPYLNAFRWPYSIATENRNLFQLQHNENQRVEDVFYYLSLELRCRRLEQWYGFTVDTSTRKSTEAQRLACRNHPTICPCHNEQRSLAFEEYL